MSNKNKITKLFSASIAVIFGAGLTLAVEARTFRVAVGDAGGSPQHELGKKFAELLNQKTGGKHQARLFQKGQLGSEQDTVNDAAMGTLDFSILAINNITPFSPTVGLFTLPYVIQSLDEAVELTQGEVGQELVENTVRDAGVRIIGWTYSGFRVLTNSKKPVRTLQDMQDLIVRVPKNEIMIDTYRAWGVNPTPMSWTETFTALQQRVVDGQDNPYMTIYAMKFYEVQKYITNMRYIFLIEPLIVSEAVFRDQSPEVQQAILDAGKEATVHSANFLREREAEIRKELASKGMQIDDPADGEKEWIEKATEAVWPKFYDSIGGKEKLNRVLRLLGRSEV